MDKYQLEENLREDRLRNLHKYLFNFWVLFSGIMIGIIIMLLFFTPINDTSLNDKAIELNVTCSFTGSQISGFQMLPVT